MEVTRAYREPDTDQIETGSLIQEAAYDGLGRRIIRRVKNSADRNITEHHYYAGQSVVEIRNGSDMVLKQKVWAGTFQAGYIDQLIQATLNADPIENPAMEREPANPAHAPRDHWALHNANFNVAALVDEDGAVAERYEYTPYGQRQVYFSPGINDPLAHAPTGRSRRWRVDGEDQPYGLNSVGHQGLLHDEHLNSQGGLIHNRARTLHPRLGRFMQRDPINQNQPGGGYQDGMSLYEYVRSNPTNILDSDGRRAGVPDKVGDLLREVGGQLVGVATACRICNATDPNRNGDYNWSTTQSIRWQATRLHRSGISFWWKTHSGNYDVFCRRRGGCIEANVIGLNSSFVIGPNDSVVLGFFWVGCEAVGFES